MHYGNSIARRKSIRQFEKQEIIMETETLAPIIAVQPFFEDMSPDQLELIAGCASNVRFNSGDFIYRQGEEANRFYLIRQGRVSLELFIPGRGSFAVQSIGPGDLLGWSWLFPPYRWKFDARATDVTRAIAFDGECLRKKCELSPILGYEMMKRLAIIVSQRLQATHLQLISMYDKQQAGL